MKILLINNHTVHLNSLGQSLAGHEVEVQTYRPGLQFNDQGKDLVILSGGGGEGIEVNDFQPTGQLWHQDEMDFIKTTDKPVVGICMGFQVIARAFGAPVTPIGQLVQGHAPVQVSRAGKKMVPAGKIVQFESHRWRVENLPSEFEILATSKHGVEMFRHKNFLATQFHPEKGGTLGLSDLVEQFTPVINA